jgi:oligosaccharide translocation protein RFT1
VNYYNSLFLVTPRARADLVAVSVRCLCTYLFVVYLDLGVLGFGLAQVGYGLSHFITVSCSITSGDISRPFKAFLPYFLPHGTEGGMFGGHVAIEALHMTASSLLKHLLTEADKIALSLSATSYDQGVYAVVANYGSLVARIVYQPLEESCRIAFSQMATDVEPGQGQGQGSSTSHMEELINLLVSVLRLIILFGGIFPVFGPCYASIAIQVLLGGRWFSQETIRSLSAFCFYLLVMGVNGVTEAFVQGVSSTGLMSSVNICLLLSSLAFVLSAPLLIHHYGTSGLITANAFSMSVRILFNVSYIWTYISSRASPHIATQRLLSALPSAIEIGSVLLTSAVIRVSSNRFDASPFTLVSIGVHILVGVVCFSSLLSVVLFSHKSEFVALFRNISLAKKVSSSKST